MFTALIKTVPVDGGLSKSFIKIYKTIPTWREVIRSLGEYNSDVVKIGSLMGHEVELTDKVAILNTFYINLYLQVYLIVFFRDDVYFHPFNKWSPSPLAKIL